MSQPAQTQDHQPGDEYKMDPKPQSLMESYKAAGKLKGKVVLISGGDSGIGRAISIGCAKEGANVAFIYVDEERDAEKTVEHIEKAGAKALSIKGDVASKDFCEKMVAKVVDKFGQLDVLINNAAEQHVAQKFEDITEEQMRRTFDTNIFGMMFLTQAALPELRKTVGTIVNTASITAYRGHDTLMDYATTKGAVVGFTRSLSGNLASENIRVNAVAPGPIWTPLIPASFSEEHVKRFGDDQPLGRAGQPDEVAPAYIFLASDDASYITGQTIHPNGGTVIGG